MASWLSQLWGGSPAGWESPGQALVAVTPSNTVEISGGKVRALYIGTGGDVVILAASDTVTQTLVTVPSGTILPICTKRVHLTGTTASNIVGIR